MCKRGSVKHSIKGDFAFPRKSDFWATYWLVEDKMSSTNQYEILHIWFISDIT